MASVSTSLPAAVATSVSSSSTSSTAAVSSSSELESDKHAAASSGPRFRNEYLRVILLGTVDPASPLRHLRGLTNTIFRRLIYPRVEELWQAHIEPGMRRGGEKGKQFMASRGFVKFPPARNINVNMMPFILGKKSSLPEELHDYWPLIQKCDVSCSEKHDQLGEVVYLTIHESQVEPNCSQRRSGLHTESPGAIFLPPEEAQSPAADAKAKVNTVEKSMQKLSLAGSQARQNPSSSSSSSSKKAGVPGRPCPNLHRVGAGESVRYRQEAYWGAGSWCDYPKDGIYMASSVGSSCQLWDASLKDPTAIVGPLGDLEHLRPVLGERGSYRPKANELVWLTDLTPHESLPTSEWTTKEEDESRAAAKRRNKKYFENAEPAASSAKPKQSTVRYRQYFRLVTKDISVWYARHSTPNPLGTKPPARVRIIQADKFESENSHQ